MRRIAFALKLWRENGASNLTVVHTRDRKVADTEAFVKPIRAARGVFFAGGRQWRLADSYLNTLAHKELNALLARGGVIGGSSAGASILTSFMVRGDTRNNEKMIGVPCVLFQGCVQCSGAKVRTVHSLHTAQKHRTHIRNCTHRTHGLRGHS